MTKPRQHHLIVKRRNQTGFSLLETLVAFAVLALVLTVVYQIFGSGSRSARLSHEYTEATVIAQSKLAEFRLTEMSSLAGIESERYQWKLQRIEADYPDPGSHDRFQRNHTLFDLNVMVSWHSMGKERKVELNSVQLLSNK